MKPGSLVKLVHQPVQKQVDVGALAIVVDGKSTFPNLYAKLLQKVTSQQIDEFVWVEWIKKDTRWFGQPDGAYAVDRFTKTTRGSVINSRRVSN